MINTRKWLSLENLIYLTVLCLPLYLVRFQVFGVPTNVLEILIIIIIIGWFILTQKSKAKSLRQRRISFWLKNSNSKLKIIIIIMFIIISGFLISAFLNDNAKAGLGIIKGWLIVPFLFFTVIYQYLNKDKISNVFLSLYISSTVVAVIALAYKFLGIITYDGRLQAFFNSPNYLAMYITPAVVIGLGGVLKLRVGGQRDDISGTGDIISIAWLTSIGIILIALYFTYSYAAWVSFLISITIILCLSHKFSKRYLSILIFICFGLAFILKDTEKFNALVNFSNRSSVASRVMIWQSAEKILKDNWLVGIGPGNFQRVYLEYQKYFPPYLEWAVPHPHNVFLAVWLSGGIMSLLGFLGLIMVFFKEIFWRIKTKTPQWSVSTNVLYISLGIMLYILIHGLADTTVLKNDLAVIFWLCFLFFRE